MGGLLWEHDGIDWPNRKSSHFVHASELRWHYQRMGSGPVLLLLHGTGASTHSWRDVIPVLARHFSVVAPDLPGHGFTSTPRDRKLTLPVMAHTVESLLSMLGVEPAIVVGHSAGAAIAARMCLDEKITPRALVSLNGALLPLHGLAGMLFPPAARLLAANPLTPHLFAWRATDRKSVERLIDSTGSRIDAIGISLYHRLIRNHRHVAGVLAMMANWDLRALERDLPLLRPELTLVVGDRDQTVRPAESARVASLLPGARQICLPGLGHLAHEEKPQKVADIVLAAARQARALPAA